MKKRITMGMLALIFLIGVGVFAYEQLTTPSELEAVTISEDKDPFITSISDLTADYNATSNFTKLIVEDNLTNSEIEYLNELVASGTTVNTVIDAYKFWKTTNEDFSLIGQLCSYEDSSYGDNWIENAFNLITENKCGVLDTEAILSYFERGLVDEDIFTANVLCRKGVLTISQILDLKCEGEQWDTISNSINGNLPQERILKVNKDGFKDLITFSSLETIENITGEPELTEESDELIENYNKNIEIAVADKLAALEISVTEESLESAEDYESKIKQAEENGYTKNLIRTFERRGYTADEILNSSVVSKEQNISPLVAIKGGSAQ